MAAEQNQRCRYCGCVLSMGESELRARQVDPVVVAESITRLGGRHRPSLGENASDENLCAQCKSDAMQRQESSPTSSPERYAERVGHAYPSAAVTSSLPRSRQWDPESSTHIPSFMPMAETSPLLTLRFPVADRALNGMSNASQGPDAQDTMQFSQRTSSSSERRPWPRLPSEPPVPSSEPVETSLRSTSVPPAPVEAQDAPPHGAGDFGPWLMSRKRLPGRTPLREEQPKPTHTSRAQELPADAPERTIWHDPHLPDLPAAISQKRIQPNTRGCLHPGAVFQGTQRNGGNSYSVTVEISNVDMAHSTLGGYLNIRGLTEEWPVLTTYFDAEIIGQRYGFVTGKWGASEVDDLKHWSRFPAFQSLRHRLGSLSERFDHINMPYVFMRWKERFLVPDHRVQNINGASFAGFYYVCVDMGQSSNRAADDGGSAPQRPSTRGHMTGYYFHESSEPYQQLSLDHVSEGPSASFEFR